MQPEIRKIVTYDEEVFIEGFKAAERPWRLFAVAAVLTNPWAGRYVENLKPEIQAFGPNLGEMMTERMIALAGSGRPLKRTVKRPWLDSMARLKHASGRFTRCALAISIGKPSRLNRTCRSPIPAARRTRLMVPLMDKTMPVGARIT